MSNVSLAVKYRPKNFDDLTEQKYIKIILENQIKSNDIRNVYLFTGPSGTGKTTSARIFASMINDGLGNPIEIDAASNNGVEQIRNIIEEAKYKSIDSKYKVYILDECHMLSIGAWNAMLKLIEEPPKTTIFILCTTDVQKVPKTILSRVQRYDFQKISFYGIVKRLTYICKKESEEIGPDLMINFDIEALEYIAKVSDGGMRDAISMLDKCLAYSYELTVKNVIQALGISDYDNLYLLLKNIFSASSKEAISVIESVYRDGKDLKLFIKQFVQFILDVCKYMLFKNYDYIQIPNTIDLSIFDEHKDYLLALDYLDNIINLYNKIKYEQNPKIFIESQIILLCERRYNNEA